MKISKNSIEVLEKEYDAAIKTFKESYPDESLLVGNDTSFLDMVSDSCKSRMNQFKITSYQYIGVVGCKYDDVKVPFTKNKRLHKEWIGVVILLCDILSIIMMYYFFSSIRRLNLEILEAMDDL